jgi:hypothetical protein
MSRTQSQPLIVGVVAMSAMAINASAAPMSTLGGLAKSIVLALTNVVQRKHCDSQARKRGGSRNPNKNRSSTTGYHELDSNNLPFGNRQWWDQQPSGAEP